MTQKLTLGANGVVQFNRMHPVTTKHTARVTPAVKLSRLRQLLNTQKPNICVVRGEGIGDVIMTLPTVRAIKEMFQGAEITYATNTKYLNGALFKVLQYNPDISHIIERDLMDDLIFDLVVNLHCPAIMHEKPGKTPPNRIDLFATHAGVKLSDPVPKFYIQKEEIESGEISLKNASPLDKLVLIQPFASSKIRSGMHTRLKEAAINLFKQYGIRSVIVTHSSDPNSDILWDNIPGSIYLKDLDIRQIAGVMVHCDLVLCPDSSILHLAGALGVPTVGLFGPTPPQSRINHYANATAVWEANLAPCPCWYEACPIRWACWDRITPDKIVSKCIEHLNASEKVDIQMLLDNIQRVEISTEVV